MFNHNIKLVFTFITLFLSSITTYANTKYVATVKKNDKPFHIDDGASRHRSQPVMITCIITPEEITVSGLSSDDINLFEVYNLDGKCIGSFTNKSDFLQFVFQTSDNIEILLYTDDYVLSGILNIN